MNDQDDFYFDGHQQHHRNIGSDDEGLSFESGGGDVDDLFAPNDPAAGHNYSVGNNDGCGRLLAILENAVNQCQNENADVFVASPEEHQRKRELLEQTWKEIRTDWLWANENREARSAAAYVRGKGDLAPLHLICKLTNSPPTDIISEIIQSAPEVAGWPDSHMWLPLHHACINGSSTEVLKLLDGVYPESKVALDNNNRTPLHLYATRGKLDNYSPNTMASNFTILAGDCKSRGAAEVRDTGGMIPMHYACAYGTTTSALKVLKEAYPESVNAKDDKGRTPLHMVMANAQNSASPAVIEFLLACDYDDANTKNMDARNTNSGKSAVRTAGVNVRDDDGNLPLHLLNIGLAGTDLEQDPEKLQNAAECLKLYLAAKPYASTDFLTALQGLPDLLRDVAVVSPHVRNILNEKIIQRFPTSILVRTINL